MSAAPTPQDRTTPAAFIAEICAALQSAGPAEEQARLEASVAACARALDARLEQLQSALDQLEARLAEIKRELGVVNRPIWPF